WPRCVTRSPSAPRATQRRTGGDVRTRAPLPTTSEPIVVAGIRLSHPDRLLYPDLGISKADLARYYEGIGNWIVPHVRGRPLTLVHCPAGLGGACMYMKHAKALGPTALRRVRIQEKT